MKQKLFLTSALAMGVIAPAFAEPSHTDTFPDDGYMQEDYTYTNAATADNMDDVYEGTVNAVAEYDVIDYILTAGKYLPKDSETITTCPAGSYCAGGETFQYSATVDQGIASCPTGYALSADGASSANECYRTCSGNVEIEHATGVTGNDYYGTGVDTCEPTGCVNGWHLKSGVNGTAIATAIGNEAGINSAIIRANGTFSEGNYDGLGTKGQAYYGLTDNMSWAIDYGDKGMLVGQARCSTVEGVSVFYGTSSSSDVTIHATDVTTHTTSELGAEAGQYCYCNVMGYKDATGNMQAMSSPWVLEGGNSGGDADGCMRECVGYCADRMNQTGSRDLVYRAALLGSVSASPAMCEANTITINWSNATAADVSANNAGTATYGSDVRTPVKAETIKGKTFKGWRFSKPEQTNL